MSGSGKSILTMETALSEKQSAELDFWKQRFADREKYGADFFHSRGMKLAFLVYCHFLGVDERSFEGKVIVDIGCGPLGSLHFFRGKLKIGVEPLANAYHAAFDLSPHDMVYLSCPAERISLPDGYADVVVSRNALDHVDDFSATIAEICRILKVDGRILIALNLQDRASVCEPQVIDEDMVKKVFKDRFDYAVSKRFPRGYVTRIVDESGAPVLEPITYDHEIIVIDGRKKQQTNGS